VSIWERVSDAEQFTVGHAATRHRSTAATTGRARIGVAGAPRRQRVVAPAP
jgi:hypothetical protein